jgi:hypothetical protein
MSSNEERLTARLAEFEAAPSPATLDAAFEAVQADSADPQAPMRVAARWLRFFTALDAAIDPQWKAGAWPSREVPLPSVHGNVAPSGEIDPATIPDPIERERYERAVQATAQASRHYDTQQRLRRVTAQAEKLVDRWIDTTASASAAHRQACEQLLAASAMPDARRQRWQAVLGRLPRT